MPKHTIDISTKHNNKVKLCRIEHPELKNVSDVIEFAIDKLNIYGTSD